jgi:hypothetical protein
MAEPAAPEPRRVASHDLELVHRRRSARLEQDVEAVGRDALGQLRVRPVRPVAEGGDLALDQVLDGVDRFLVGGIAEHPDLLAVVALEQRQGEAGDRVVAQVRRQEAHAQPAAPWQARAGQGAEAG